MPKFPKNTSPFRMKGISPLKHPTHKEHHPSKEKLSEIAKKTSTGWPKLKDE